MCKMCVGHIILYALTLTLLLNLLSLQNIVYCIVFGIIPYRSIQCTFKEA